MILPDVNVLVYAYRADMADHERYRDWLSRMVNAGRPGYVGGTRCSHEREESIR